MTLAERYAKLEPRERTLLTGLGVALALIVFFFVPLYLHQLVSSSRDENQAIRDYLDKVSESRTKIDRQNAERNVVTARYARAMPPLASFVEDAARSANIEIEESGAKPDVPHGKKYVEHVLLMKLRNVGLLGIVKTFEKIERSNYPVAITRLNLKPRSDPDAYDVEAHVSAYELKDGPKKEPAKDADDAEEEETP